jgi:LexA-binding, inner membrane-associated putative hydrolase
MASYKGHLTFSTALGAAYGAAGMFGLGYDWGAAGLAGGLTAVGGLLPDLDSDSGVPVREMFGLAAAFTPFLLYNRLLADPKFDHNHERVIVALAVLYLFIRYGLSNVFRRLTVHRGMYHSIPAMLIAGLSVYLLEANPSRGLRVYLAGGVMLGFLSHLVLDEIFSVDFMGLKIRLNKYAGSALKFFSPSWSGTLLTYLILAALGYLAFLDWQRL